MPVTKLIDASKELGCTRTLCIQLINDPCQFSFPLNETQIRKQTRNPYSTRALDLGYTFRIPSDAGKSPDPDLLNHTRKQDTVISNFLSPLADRSGLI